VKFARFGTVRALLPDADDSLGWPTTVSVLDEGEGLADAGSVEAGALESLVPDADD
jgi:hypothetical protein